jgi:hypothetical protein
MANEQVREVIGIESLSPHQSVTVTPWFGKPDFEYARDKIFELYHSYE